MLNHNSKLFLIGFFYCFCLFGEFAKVFEKQVWRVRVVRLHTGARALWSPCLCFQWALFDIYVICQPGGPHWEKLCQRSWLRPEAAGRGPYPRPRAQFFPIRTDLGRQTTCLLFSSVEYFVSSFCVEFSLQPFSNLVYACVWHLGRRKSNQHYTLTKTQKLFLS